MSKRLDQIERAIREIKAKIEIDSFIDEKTNDLTFGEALLHLKAGKNVSRWPAHIHLWLSNSDDHILPVIWVQTVNHEHAPWHPNHSDLLATNWRVVEKDNE